MNALPHDPAAAPLAALAARARDDLHQVSHPRLPWLEPRMAPGGTPALDVLVVGGGQSGLAVAVGLLRAHVTNILVVDRAGRGIESALLRAVRECGAATVGLPVADTLVRADGLRWGERVERARLEEYIDQAYERTAASLSELPSALPAES